MLVSFMVGYAAITVFSLGRVTQDERDLPGLNPVSRLPDGRIGLSESAIETIGMVVQGLVFLVLIGLAWLWLRYR
jgi:hypothetical protein